MGRKDRETIPGHSQIPSKVTLVQIDFVSNHFIRDMLSSLAAKMAVPQLWFSYHSSGHY